MQRASRIDGQTTESRHSQHFRVARTNGRPPYAAGLKARDAIRLIEQDGWRHIRTVGSHRQFRHETKPGTVTIAGKPGVDVPIGTLKSILKQAGLKRQQE